MCAYQDFGLYIAGQWGPAIGRGTKAVLDPATEDVIGQIPEATEADLDRALQSAAKGFAAWRQVQPWERGTKLRRVADLIRERIEAYSQIMSIDTGKPLAEARGEWNATADQFEWYAEETKRICGQIIEGGQSDVRLSVIWQPVGVVAAFSAWNFPALLPARKIAAALGAGCSILSSPPVKRRAPAWRWCKPAMMRNCRLARSISSLEIPFDRRASHSFANRAQGFAHRRRSARTCSASPLTA